MEHPSEDLGVRLSIQKRDREQGGNRKPRQWGVTKHWMAVEQV